MPDVQGEKIVIAAEEEAYLRSAFRRFALPYLIGLVAVTTFIFAMLASGVR